MVEEIVNCPLVNCLERRYRKEPPLLEEEEVVVHLNPFITFIGKEINQCYHCKWLLEEITLIKMKEIGDSTRNLQ